MKSPDKLTRHQVLLYEGDFDKLSALYRRRSATEVIRTLVRNFLNDIERPQAGNENNRRAAND